MEGGSLEMTCTSVPDSGLQSDWSMACLRRRAWAQSRDSLWQEPEPESDGPKGSQQGQRVGDNQKPSDESGGVQNNTITSWLSECRIPLRPSLDDQSASPSRGTLKNGCSFEDDLSLGAEGQCMKTHSPLFCVLWEFKYIDERKSSGCLAE
ncbi:hypothetical protein LDENG_00248260 [Lucifuga dentata]|nr:hypothetical protein LDENG_00248260 [Lucifuga dentata]